MYSTAPIDWADLFMPTMGTSGGVMVSKLDGQTFV